MIVVIDLNDLLVKAGLDPAQIMVMRHRPTEKDLREVLPWLAAERHEIYNAYQSGHGEKVERALGRVTHLVSFIGHEPRRAVFVGVYSIDGLREVSAKQFWKIPENQELRKLGTRGPKDERRSLWFDLHLTEHLLSLKGRLVIEWSGIERAWWRRAERNAFPVHAIHDDSLLVKRLSDWQSLVLSWQALQALPSSWKRALGEWRGIYYIFDKGAEKGYVGSAYGTDNLIGRWTNYAVTGHGGNRLLRARNPEDFSFSILQRVSPDMDVNEIVALESSWKERLHSRAPFGLNDN
ncbi:MAG: GIY-YIG nuclease family protein [Burkholderiales bacterium]|nr:MAG: GIY-YIG nuclease family protein [Burkholderiales bacterium]